MNGVRDILAEIHGDGVADELYRIATGGYDLSSVASVVDRPPLLAGGGFDAEVQPDAFVMSGPTALGGITGLQPEQIRDRQIAGLVTHGALPIPRVGSVEMSPTDELRVFGVEETWRDSLFGMVGSKTLSLFSGLAQGIVDLVRVGFDNNALKSLSDWLGKPVEEEAKRASIQAQRALMNYGVGGYAATMIANTALDIAAFLLSLHVTGGSKLLSAAGKIGKLSTATRGGVFLSNLSRAATFAAMRFATTPGNLEDKIKAASISLAYVGTPAVSGLIGPVGSVGNKFLEKYWGLAVRGTDFLLNSIITGATGSYKDAMERGQAEADLMGKPEMGTILGLANLLPLIGSDAFFSATTRGFFEYQRALAGSLPVDLREKLGPDNFGDALRMRVALEKYIMQNAEKIKTNGINIPENIGDMSLDDMAKYVNDVHRKISQTSTAGLGVPEGTVQEGNNAGMPAEPSANIATSAEEKHKAGHGSIVGEIEEDVGRAAKINEALLYGKATIDDIVSELGGGEAGMRELRRLLPSYKKVAADADTVSWFVRRYEKGEPFALLLDEARETFKYNRPLLQVLKNRMEDSNVSASHASAFVDEWLPNTIVNAPIAPQNARKIIVEIRALPNKHLLWAATRVASIRGESWITGTSKNLREEAARYIIDIINGQNTRSPIRPTLYNIINYPHLFNSREIGAFVVRLGARKLDNLMSAFEKKYKIRVREYDDKEAGARNLIIELNKLSDSTNKKLVEETRSAANGSKDNIEEWATNMFSMLRSGSATISDVERRIIAAGAPESSGDKKTGSVEASDTDVVSAAKQPNVEEPLRKADIVASDSESSAQAEVAKPSDVVRGAEQSQEKAVGVATSQQTEKTLEESAAQNKITSAVQVEQKVDANIEQKQAEQGGEYHAIQKRAADEVHVRESPEDRTEVGEEVRGAETTSKAKEVTTSSTEENVAPGGRVIKEWIGKTEQKQAAVQTESKKAGATTSSAEGGGKGGATPAQTGATSGRVTRFRNGNVGKGVVQGLRTILSKHKTLAEKLGVSDVRSQKTALDVLNKFSNVDVRDVGDDADAAASIRLLRDFHSQNGLPKVGDIVFFKVRQGKDYSTGRGKITEINGNKYTIEHLSSRGDENGQVGTKYVITIRGNSGVPFVKDDIAVGIARVASVFSGMRIDALADMFGLSERLMRQIISGEMKVDRDGFIRHRVDALMKSVSGHDVETLGRGGDIVDTSSRIESGADERLEDSDSDWEAARVRSWGADTGELRGGYSKERHGAQFVTRPSIGAIKIGEQKVKQMISSGQLTAGHIETALSAREAYKNENIDEYDKLRTRLEKSNLTSLIDFSDEVLVEIWNAVKEEGDRRKKILASADYRLLFDPLKKIERQPGDTGGQPGVGRSGGRGADVSLEEYRRFLDSKSVGDRTPRELLRSGDAGREELGRNVYKALEAMLYKKAGQDDKFTQIAGELESSGSSSLLEFSPDVLIRCMAAMNRKPPEGWRYQEAPPVAKPASRLEIEQVASQIARASGAIMTKDAETNDIVLDYGTMQVRVVHGDAVDAILDSTKSGAVKKNAGGYTIYVSPKRGDAITVAHEFGHIVRDFLREDEIKTLSRALGIDLTTREGEESFVRALETPQGRDDVANKLRLYGQNAPNIFVRMYNRIVNFLNSTLGLKLKRIGNIDQIESLADQIQNLHILRRLAAGEHVSSAEFTRIVRPSDDADSRLTPLERKFKIQGDIEVSRLESDQYNPETGMVALPSLPKRIANAWLRAMSGFVQPIPMLRILSEKLADSFADTRRIAGQHGDGLMMKYWDFVERNKGIIQDINKRPQREIKVGRIVNGVLVTTSIKIDVPRLMYIAQQVMAERAIGKIKGEDGKKIFSTFVMEPCEGNTDRIFMLNDALKDGVLSSLREDEIRIIKDLSDLSNSEMYPLVSGVYKSGTGMDLEWRPFYLHIKRDPTLLTMSREMSELAARIQMMPLTYGLSPESYSIVRQMRGSGLPVVASNIFQASYDAFRDASHFVKASYVRAWIGANITKNTPLVEMLSRGESGRIILEYFRDMHSKVGGVVNIGLDNTDKWMNAVLNRMTVARLGSPFVWAKQPMSLFAGAQYFNDMKYLRAAFSKRRNQIFEEVLKRSAYMQRRVKERQYDVFMAGVNYDHKTKDPLLEHGQKIVTTGMGAGDLYAMKAISAMAADYVSEKFPNLKGEEYWNKVAEETDKAVQYSQVATDDLDRTMYERNVTSPLKRMLVYMYGARAKQANLLFDAAVNAWIRRDRDSIHRLTIALLATGLAQSGSIAMVDLARSRMRRAMSGSGDDENESIAQKAAAFALLTMENALGSAPLSGEFVPAIMSPLYYSVGERELARLRSARIGQGGVFSQAYRDAHSLFVFARDLLFLEADMKAARTRSERRMVENKFAFSMRSARKALVRTIAELTGLPYHHVVLELSFLNEGKSAR